MVEAAKNGASRFSLMNQASTNHAQIKKYITSLIDMGFVEAYVENSQVLYRTSYHGIAFLRQYHILQEMTLGRKLGLYPMMVTQTVARRKARAL